MKRADLLCGTSIPVEIKCPECGTSIPVSEAISHQIAERVSAESKAEARRQQEAFAAREKKLAEKERDLDKKVDERVKADQARIEKEAQKKARQDVALEFEDLKQQVAEKDEKLTGLQKAELELRKQKRQLEEKDRSLDLEVARKVDAERDKIRSERDEEHRLKNMEKDKKLQDALKANDELRRKLEQGSQKTQGDVLQLELEKVLRAAFDHDKFEPVRNGVNGADVVHCVMTNSGRMCGPIVWESKNTKNWSDNWVAKLKDDQRLVKADIAVVVSEVLPKGYKNFGWYKGIWVSSPGCAVALAFVFRAQLIEVARAQMAAVGRNEKKDLLYNYACTEFRQRVEAMVEAIVEMQSGLAEKKRAMPRQLAREAKQIEKVMAAMAGLYGDVQGLIGASLPTIPLLSLAGEQDDPSEAADEDGQELIGPPDSE